jgi:hypothetical protein
MTSDLFGIARVGASLTALALAATQTVLGGACGPSTGGPGNDDDAATAPGTDGAPPVPGSVRVAPGDVVLYVEGGVAQTQTYTATFIHDDGQEEDVTAEATFTVDHPWLGEFVGPTFTSVIDRAGHTIVRASARGQSGAANLTVHLTHVIIVGEAPADAPDVFAGAGAGGPAPAIVYPPAGIIVPPNMNVLELHFVPGAGQTLFQLALVGETLSLELYLVCQPLAEGCAFEPDETIWLLLAEAARGDDLFVTLRGVDAGAPAPKVGVSPAQTVSFTREDLLGGIYYWNAGAGNIKRYDFGRRGQSAEDYLNQAQAGATTCVGCHAISRDGTRIAVGLDIPAPSVVKTFAVATRSEIWSAGSLFGGGGANFFTFSPDTSQMISSNGVSLVLRDAASGAALTDPLVANGTMPDWSANGSAVVYARSDTPPPCFGPICGAPGIGAGNIVLMTAGVWTDPTVLVPAGGGNQYYPAFAPDSEWIVFNRSAGSDSFDAPDAQVWAVAGSGGAPIRLLAGSPAPGGDSWPKWAPFIHTYKDRQIFWLTFSSRRDYGLRLENSTAAEKRAQIWMIGFDPATAQAGSDGSYPAFWLPFQELTSGNHIAQWVEEVDRQPCDEPEDCPGNEFCEEGYCVPYVE